MRKTVVFVGDPHCGAALGLTPPAWMSGMAYPTLRASQKTAWNLYGKIVGRLAGPHLLVVNGDAIEGLARKNHGVGLLTSDLDEQVRIAEACLWPWNAKNILVTAGTRYHTDAEGQSYEAVLARNVGAEYGPEHRFSVNGLSFYCRHKIGRSTNPHGRHTPSAKSHMLNELEAADGKEPLAKIMVHSHVHYFSRCGGDGWEAFTTPLFADQLLLRDNGVRGADGLGRDMVRRRGRRFLRVQQGDRHPGGLAEEE